MDNAQHDNSFLIFRVGPYHLAVPAVYAEAIITMPEIRSVPLTPDSVSGVFSHRGKITVVISLKRKFGLKESDDRSSGQLIISPLSQGLKAFRVDEVLDIIPASGLNFSTLPALDLITAFDSFAVKNNEIILRTDFELLYRLEDSKELADSLKSLTKDLKPKSDSDKLVPDEDIPVSETNSQTILEENTEQESTIQSDSHDFSRTDGNPLYINTEKFSKQKPEMAGKRFVLKSGKKPSRKAIPYKARTIQRKTSTGYRLPPNHQSDHKKPKRYRWLAVVGILFLTVLFISMIWMWPQSHKDLKVAYRSQKTDASSSRDVSARPVDLPPQQVTDDSSNDVLEDKNDDTFKPEEIAGEERIQLETKEKISETVEKNNTDFTRPQKSKEVLRIETDDFTLTIERPQSQKTEPTKQLDKQPVFENENPQILKTEKQQPLKTEQAPPEKTDEQFSMHVAAGKMKIIHIVVKGDTLWDIAAKYLGDPFRYPELAKLSRISDPDLIYPGDLIRITKKKKPVMAKQKGSCTPAKNQRDKKA
jgi:chemotaxis signal transduction protein/LysM repeat protein